MKLHPILQAGLQPQTRLSRVPLGLAWSLHLGDVSQPSPPPSGCKAFPLQSPLGGLRRGEHTPMETQPPSQVPCNMSAGWAPLVSVTEGVLGFGDPTVHFHPGQAGPS